MSPGAARDRVDSTLTRTAVVLSVGVLLLAMGLHARYQWPRFEEGSEKGTEPRLLVWLVLMAGAVIWLARPGACAMVDVVVAPVRRFGHRAVVAFVVLALAAFLIVANHVLDGFPNSADELAYVMQAQTYAEGRLSIDPPPVYESFSQIHFVALGDKWVSRYAPGWAVILMPAAVLGLPLWTVTPFVGAATLLAFYVLSRRFVSRESAWIGVLTIGLSSFFILNSSSFFNHSLTAFYGVVFAIFGTRYIARGGIWCALAVGLCIGLMGITRTQNAVIFALPYVIALAMTPGRRMGLIWFGLGGAPFLAALLAYNYVITGHPLTAVAVTTRHEPFGAPSAKSLWLTWRRFTDLIIWTSPVLALGYIVAFFTAIKRRQTDFTDWIMPATVVLFLFFSAYGGNQYGPRYYFEAWPFAVLTVLKVIDPILFGVQRPAAAPWIASGLVASLMFECAYLPARLEREHRVVVERQDVYRQAEKEGLDNAIVIVASKVGTIRPMPPGDLIRNGLHIGEQKVLYAPIVGHGIKSCWRIFLGGKYISIPTGVSRRLPIASNRLDPFTVEGRLRLRFYRGGKDDRLSEQTCRVDRPRNGPDDRPGERLGETQTALLESRTLIGSDPELEQKCQQGHSKIEIHQL
jgi:hypothetical protein